MNTPAADAAPAGLPSDLPSGYWQELATTDFARIDAARTIALLPVAAIEQHGPHLPLATDALINQGVVAQALQRLPPSTSVLVLPALTIGDSLEHTAFPGTLSADLDDLVGLWLAVGRSVARAGVKKLVMHLRPDLVRTAKLSDSPSLWALRWTAAAGCWAQQSPRASAG